MPEPHAEPGTVGLPLVIRLMPVLDFGGVESRIVLQSSRAFQRGYRLRIATLSRAGAAAEKVRAEGIEVDHLDLSPSPRSTKTLVGLTRYLRRLKPDIVHSSISEATFFGSMATRLAGVPVHIAEEVGMPYQSPMARVVFTGVFGTADRVVGVTDAVCSFLRKTNRVPTTRLRRIYNCAHPRFFPEERASPRTPSGRFRFLAVGRLTRVKNHLRLLEAFRKVVDAQPDTELTIFGDGELKQVTQEKIRSLGLSDHVRLPGFESDVRPRLLEAHAYILSSLREGCSISLVEALSTALPALGSRVPGILEVLGTERSDQLCFEWSDVDEMARRMLWMRTLDDSARRTLAVELQNRAYEQFSPQRYMAEVQQMYFDALAEFERQPNPLLRLARPSTSRA